MAPEVAGTRSVEPGQLIEVRHESDVSEAGRQALAFATALGFEERAANEIALAVRELASNLVKHAGQGTLTLARISESGRAGLQVDSSDSGPGIADVERALTDGFSTTASLGYGLGAVNRLMDSLEIVSPADRGGTRIVCRRWLPVGPLVAPSPIDFGVASRPHPAMTVNGDAFVIKSWQGHALAAVMDGLGHGQFAHRAVQAARAYVESHCDRPLVDIFHGTGRACRATRGVVMAVARIDLTKGQLTFASIGNVEARVFGAEERMGFVVRRGILGVNAPKPVVTEHRWEPKHVLVLHTDGLVTHWRWQDYAHVLNQSASRLAHELLRTLAKEDDDATVVVVRGDAHE